MYIVHGLTRSYFTRKVTGYLDYTDRPWRLEPCPPGDHLGAQAAGWTGGIPVVTEPDDALMWDSTTIIEHLDLRTDADRRILPDDPTMRFLAHLLDDFSDEWFYRPAVGSRWNYEGNTEAAGLADHRGTLDDRWVPWWADAAQRRRHDAGQLRQARRARRHDRRLDE